MSLHELSIALRSLFPEQTQAIAKATSEADLARCMEICLQTQIEATNELEKTLNALSRVNPQPATCRRITTYFESFLKARQGKAAAIAHLERHVPDWPDERIKARAYNSLGLFRAQVNRFDPAQEAISICIDLCDRLSGAAEDIRGKAYTNQCLIYRRLGDYENAMIWAERRLQLAREGGERQAEGIALHNLAHAEQHLGLWDRAIGHYEQSHEISSGRGNMERAGQTLLNLGEVRLWLGDFERAQQHLVDALPLFEGDPPNHYDAADVVQNRGFLCFVQDDFAKAEEHYFHALEHLRQCEGERRLLESQIYFRLGQLYQALDEPERARDLYRQAIDIFEEARHHERRESTRVSIIGRGQHMYQSLILLCVEMGEVHLALTYVEKAKARALLDMLLLEDVEFTGATKQPMTAEQIQSGLPSKSAILEFFATGPSGPEATMLEHLPTESRFMAEYLAPPSVLLTILVTSSGIFVNRCKATSERIVAQYFSQKDRRLLGIHPRNMDTSTLRRWKALGSALFAGNHESMHDIRHTILVPYGVTHYLPLHALDPDLQPFCNQHTVSYAPSATIALGMLASKKGAVPALKNCVAVGLNHNDLLFSEWEADLVARNFGGRGILGEEASVSTVSDALSGANVIHFATHGMFNADHPMLSGLLLTDGELTAQHILSSIRLAAEIVTLAACDTGLSQLAYGDEPYGLIRAFLGAGARSVIATLWPIHEIPSTLFMMRFYDQWASGVSVAVAFRQAQVFLRSISVEQALETVSESNISSELLSEVQFYLESFADARTPFNHPFYWGAYILVGAYQ